MDLQEEVGWGLGWIDLVKGHGAGCCECCYEPPDSIKCGEFLDLLRTRQRLKKDSAARIHSVHVAHSDGRTSLSKERRFMNLKFLKGQKILWVSEGG